MLTGSRHVYSELYKRLKHSKAKKLLSVLQIFAARIEVFYGHRFSRNQPVLIYQMGKVGSTSLLDSLNAAGLPDHFFFVHFLSEYAARNKKRYEQIKEVPVPYHLELGLALRRRVLHSKNQKYKIISMVREPIAREISNIFQNPGLSGVRMRNGARDEDLKMMVEYVNRRLHDHDSFDYVFNWFDRELKSVFDIDVFEEKFDTARGWKTYSGKNAEALIIRLESFNEALIPAVCNFLNISNFKMINSNIRSTTKDSASYQYVKSQIQIKRAICERIYSSRFARHFYNQDEIDGFTTKWSGTNYNNRIPASAGMSSQG